MEGVHSTSTSTACRTHTDVRAENTENTKTSTGRDVEGGGVTEGVGVEALDDMDDVDVEAKGNASAGI